MERGDLAADKAMLCAVLVLFKNYLPSQPFDGLGLYACTHHSYRNGASFLEEGGGGRILPFCCEAGAEMKLSEHKGQSSPKKALVVEGEECSANTAEKEQREFKAQSCQLVCRVLWFPAPWAPLFSFFFLPAKWKKSQAAKLREIQCTVSFVLCHGLKRW